MLVTLPSSSSSSSSLVPELSIRRIRESGVDIFSGCAAKMMWPPRAIQST